MRSRVRCGCSSGCEAATVWICGDCRSSVNIYVLGAEVARSMRSAAARGEVADLERAMNGCSLERATISSDE